MKNDQEEINLEDEALKNFEGHPDQDRLKAAKSFFVITHDGFINQVVLLEGGKTTTTL